MSQRYMNPHIVNDGIGGDSNLSMDVLLVLFLTSLSSTIEVILECSIGFILSKFKPLKILDRDRIRFLSKLWFNLFIPCLFFINLTASFSLDVFREIYVVFLFSVILEVLGIVLGKLLFLKWFWRGRLDEVSRSVLTLTLVCHTSVSLPLVYIVALCNVSTMGSNPVYNLTFDQAHKSAMTTLSVFIIPTEFVFCTIGFNSFRNGAAQLQKEYEEEAARLKVEETTRDLSENSVNELEMIEEEPIVNTIHEKDNEMDEEQVEHQLIIESQHERETNLSKIEILKQFFQKNWTKLKELLKNLISPPLISIVIAISIALITPLKEFLIIDPPIFVSSVKNICKVFSQAVSPAALIILGGNLGITLLKEEEEENVSNNDLENHQNFATRFQKFKHSLIRILKVFKIKKIHPLAILISLVTKLIVFPLIGVGLVYAGIYLGIVPSNDPLLILVVLIQFSMPMAMSLTSLSSLNNDYGQEQVCELLLWHYLLCPLTLSLFSAWFLSLSCQLMGTEFNDKCNI